MTAHNQWLSTTLSIPYWTTSVFSSTVTDLVPIYESVISSDSVVRWLALYSWTLKFWILSRLKDWSNWTLQSQSESESESESELLYNWRFTGNHFVLATSILRIATSNFVFQHKTCSYSPSITSSVTRGWVCHLQLLLGSPAQSFSGPSPAGLMTMFYCLRFETPNLEGQVPAFISPRNRVTQV
jgi:hypothetical protein